MVALQLLILLGGAGAYLLTQLEPSWWRDVKADGAAAQTAEQVENGVVSQLSLARPADPKQTGSYKSEPWSVSISDQDANAWLATRLKPWLENQGVRWPERIVGVEVAFEPGVVKAGVRLVAGAGVRVLYLEARPEVRADGSLWLVPTSMGAGAMPLPTGLVLSQLRGEIVDRMPQGSSQAQAEGGLDALAGRAPALKETVMKLEDGRHVRLVGIKVLDGRAELTCRTEKD